MDILMSQVSWKSDLQNHVNYFKTAKVVQLKKNI